MAHPLLPGPNETIPVNFFSGGSYLTDGFLAEELNQERARILLLEQSGGGQTARVVRQTPSTTASFDTLEEGLENAQPLDLVTARPGVYPESVVVPPGVILRGEMERACLLTGSGPTGTRVTLQGGGAKIQDFFVDLPTDAAPAILNAAAGSSIVRNVNLRGQGAAGIGVRNSGPGVLVVLNLSWTGGEAACVLECLAGIMTANGINVTSFNAVAVALRVATGGSAIVDSMAAFGPGLVTGFLVEDGFLEATVVNMDNLTNGVRITNDAATVKMLAARLNGGVLNHVVIDPGVVPAEVIITSSELRQDRITRDPAANASLFISGFDRTPGDAGFFTWGQISSGSPGNGKELVVGEGDSYPDTVKRNDNLEVGTWDDISVEMASSEASTADAFPGVAAGNAVYFGSDFPFCGVKLNVTAAIDLGGGSIVWEYWDGAAWQAFVLMTADSVGENPRAYAQDVFGRAAFEQVRWDASAWTWPQKLLDGATKFWARSRVVGGITTSPTLQQVKYQTNRTETNPNGVVEHFGEAEPEKSLRWHLQNATDLTGKASGNGTVTVSPNLSLDLEDNVLADNIFDGISGEVEIPEGLDTSRPVTMAFNWIPKGVGGDVEFEGVSAPASVGDVLDGTLPEVPYAQVLPAGGVANAFTKSVQTFAVDDLVPGDSLFFSLSRDARGTNPEDTHPGAVHFVSLDFRGTFWRG